MPAEPLTIVPDAIYRMQDAKALFGYSSSVLRERIKNGSVPRPILLSPPPSRARGWYGHQVLAHREKVAASQGAWAADAKENFYAPKGGDLRKAAEATATPKPAAKPKVKKVKLIPPRKAKAEA